MRDHFPSFIHPQLASPVQKPPIGMRWLHEEKYDGYRFLCRMAGESVRLLTRNGNDWSSERALHPIIKDLRAVVSPGAWLDGEIIAFGPEGHSNFQVLQNAFRPRSKIPLYYVVFDLMFLRGRDVRDLSLDDRKALLQKLFSKRALTHVALAPFYLGEGVRYLQQAAQQRLEGIISKDRLSPYTSGRSSRWQKSKCIGRDDFIICGFTTLKGSDNQIGALLLGTKDRKLGSMKYMGRVGTGFSDRTRSQLFTQLSKLERSKVPFSHPPAFRNSPHWITPTIACEVHYTEITAEGLLRHPVFLGIRDDARRS